MIQYIRASHGCHHPFFSIPLGVMGHDIRTRFIKEIHSTVGIYPHRSIVGISLGRIVLTFGIVVPVATGGSHPIICLC